MLRTKSCSIDKVIKRVIRDTYFKADPTDIVHIIKSGQVMRTIVAEILVEKNIKVSEAYDAVDEYISCSASTYEGQAKLREFMIEYDKFLEKSHVYKNAAYAKYWYDLVQCVTPDGRNTAIPATV